MKQSVVALILVSMGLLACSGGTTSPKIDNTPSVSADPVPATPTVALTLVTATAVEQPRTPTVVPTPRPVPAAPIVPTVQVVPATQTVRVPYHEEPITNGLCHDPGQTLDGEILFETEHTCLIVSNVDFTPRPVFPMISVDTIEMYRDLKTELEEVIRSRPDKIPDPCMIRIFWSPSANLNGQTTVQDLMVSGCPR